MNEDIVYHKQVTSRQQQAITWARVDLCRHMILIMLQ